MLTSYFQFVQLIKYLTGFRASSQMQSIGSDCNLIDIGHIQIESFKVLSCSLHGSCFAYFGFLQDKMSKKISKLILDLLTNFIVSFEHQIETVCLHMM